MSDWIGVNIRKPDVYANDRGYFESDIVIVCYGNGARALAQLVKNEDIEFWDSQSAININSPCGDVIAWQPLPPPYKNKKVTTIKMDVPDNCWDCSLKVNLLNQNYCLPQKKFIHIPADGSERGCKLYEIPFEDWDRNIEDLAYRN